LDKAKANGIRKVKHKENEVKKARKTIIYDKMHRLNNTYKTIKGQILSKCYAIQMHKR
jgi:hypothetical protein